MPRRPKPIDLTAGVLVVAALLVWSVWGTREIRRRNPGEAPNLTTAPAALPRAASSEGRLPPGSSSGEPSPRRSLPDGEGQQGQKSTERLPEILARIWSALKLNPENPAPMALLASVPDAEAGNALLEFGSAPHSKEVRLEALRLLGDRGFDGDQLLKAAALFQAEGDEDIRLALLLGVTKLSGSGAEAIARQGTADRSEAIRSVALSALDPENEANRRLLSSLALSDPSDLVRANATLLLHERTGDPGVLDTILTVALQDACDENRKQAIQLLGRGGLLNDRRVLEALQGSAARDPSSDVRSEAQSLLEASKKRK